MVSKSVVKRKVGKPKGSPKSGGRKKGTPNKITSEVKELAQRFGEEVIDQLHHIATNKKSSDGDKIAAIKELLNRGYGKAPAPIHLGGPDGAPLSITIDYFKSLPEDQLMAFLERFMTEVLDNPERRMRLAAEAAETERLNNIFAPQKPVVGSSTYRPPVSDEPASEH
jgi:hypothetical protein